MKELLNKEVSLKILLVIVVASLLVGFFSGQGYTKYQIRMAIENTFNISENDSSDDTRLSDSEESEEVITLGMDKTIQLATIDVKVRSWEEIDIIPQSYGSPILPSEGAKLIKVNVTVTNTTNSEFTLGSDWASIQTEEGKTFSEDDDAWDLDDYISYETLKPDIAVQGSILYEISEESSDLYLAMGKAGTNKIYKIKLEK